MKKTIYLLTNGIWKSFEYEKLSDLKEEFATRYITIGEFATIGESATIGEFARIGKSARIGESARIGKSATIGEFINFKISALYIIGSKHIVNYFGDGKIQIGCYLKTFNEWTNEFEAIGKKTVTQKPKLQNINLT